MILRIIYLLSFSFLIPESFVQAKEAAPITPDSSLEYRLGIRYTCPIEENHQAEFFRNVSQVFSASQQKDLKKEEILAWQDDFKQEAQNWMIEFKTGETEAERVRLFIDKNGHGQMSVYDSEKKEFVSRRYNEAPEKMYELFGLILDRPEELARLSLGSRCEFGNCRDRPRDAYLDANTKDSSFLAIRNRDYREANWISKEFKNESVTFTHLSEKDTEGNPITLEINLSESVLSRLSSYLEVREQEGRNWTNRFRHSESVCLFKNDCSGETPTSVNLDTEATFEEIQSRLSDTNNRLRLIRELIPTPKPAK